MTVNVTCDAEPDELEVDVDVLGAGVGRAIDRQRHFRRLNLPASRSDGLKEKLRFILNAQLKRLTKLNSRQLVLVFVSSTKRPVTHPSTILILTEQQYSPRAGFRLFQGNRLHRGKIKLN